MKENLAQGGASAENYNQKLKQPSVISVLKRLKQSRGIVKGQLLSSAWWHKRQTERVGDIQGERSGRSGGCGLFIPTLVPLKYNRRTTRRLLCTNTFHCCYFWNGHALVVYQLQMLLLLGSVVFQWSPWVIEFLSAWKYHLRIQLLKLMTSNLVLD